MTSNDDWKDRDDTWSDKPDPWDQYEHSLKDHPQEQWADWQQRGYDTPAGPGAHGPLPHSGLGIASVVLTVFAGIGLAIAVVIAALIVAENPNQPPAQNDPQLIAVGCGIFLGLGVAAIGGALGLIGLFQQDRQKLFPILGCIFAFLELAGIGGLMMLGFMLG